VGVEGAPTSVSNAIAQATTVGGIRDAHVVQLDVGQFPLHARLLHVEGAELLVDVAQQHGSNQNLVNNAKQTHKAVGGAN